MDGQAVRAGGRAAARVDRVIAANQVLDHCTTARFRQRHEDALAGLFGSSRRLASRSHPRRAVLGLKLRPAARHGELPVQLVVFA